MGDGSQLLHYRVSVCCVRHIDTSAVLGAIIAHMPNTPDTRIVLSSASPRRRRLLDWLSLDFETTSVDTAEELDTPLAADPQALATSLAREKILATRALSEFDGAMVLTFDTIVVLDGNVLGKPVDLPDAWRMLRALSGRTHQVVTGCSIMCPESEQPQSFAVTTDVRMLTLSDCQIEAWMSAGEFMGCAGAYNIEGQVAEVTPEDCYQNVAGMPLCHLYAALQGTLPGVLRPRCLSDEPRSPIPACNAALGRTCALGSRIVT